MDRNNHQFAYKTVRHYTTKVSVMLRVGGAVTEKHNKTMMAKQRTDVVPMGVLPSSGSTTGSGKGLLCSAEGVFLPPACLNSLCICWMWVCESLTVNEEKGERRQKRKKSRPFEPQVTAKIF